MAKPLREDVQTKAQDPPEAGREGLDLEGALNALLDLSGKVVESTACGIFRLDGDRLEFLAVRNFSPAIEQGLRRLHERGRIERTTRSARPVRAIDPGDGGQQLALAPIAGQTPALAAFFLWCVRPGPYAEDELDLIATLASQAAVALENDRLYRNLTETHQKLKASQSQLVQSGKLAAVGQLAAGVAHEVNNPLQIILSRVQLLMMRHRQEERLVGDLQLIESNVKRISRIIRSLLDFARHNSGAEDRRTVDLLYLATQTSNLMQHLMEKGGIEVNIVLKGDESPQVYGNVGELEQVFLNLLLNAQQAMPDGGRIDIELSSDGNTATACIRDTGEGIPEEHLSRIFDPFFTTRETQGGTGLGLSIIYGIIEKHDGEITVESQQDIGTAFTIRFPAAVPEDGEEASPLAPGP